MITYDVCFGSAIYWVPGKSIATFRSKKEALAFAVRSSNEHEYGEPFTIVKVTETGEGWEFENLAMVFQGEVFIRSGRDFGGGV